MVLLDKKTYTPFPPMSVCSGTWLLYVCNVYSYNHTIKTLSLHLQFQRVRKKRTWFIIFDPFRKALFTVSCHWFWSFLWNVSPSVGWIALIFGTDIHSAQKMDCIHFGDPLTFHLAPPEGQSYHLSKWNISTSTGRTDTNVCTGICGSQTMNDTDFGDHLTFTLANHEVDICGFSVNFLVTVGGIG